MRKPGAGSQQSHDWPRRATPHHVEGGVKLAGMHMTLWIQLSQFTNRIDDYFFNSRALLVHLCPHLVNCLDIRDGDGHALIEARMDGLFEHGKHHPPVRPNQHSPHPLPSRPVGLSLYDYLTRHLGALYTDDTARHQVVLVIPFTQSKNVALRANHPGRDPLGGLAIDQREADSGVFVSCWEELPQAGGKWKRPRPPVREDQPNLSLIKVLVLGLQWRKLVIKLAFQGQHLVCKKRAIIVQTSITKVRGRLQHWLWLQTSQEP